MGDDEVMSENYSLNAARRRAQESRREADRATARAEAAQLQAAAALRDAGTEPTGGVLILDSPDDPGTVETDASAIESAPELSAGDDGRSRRSVPMWWVCGLLAICLLVVSAFAVVSAAEKETGGAKPQTTDVVESARTAVSQLVSVKAAKPDQYVDQVLNDATGAWKSEFLERKDSVIGVLGSATSDAGARVVDAGFERWNPDGSGSVLVVVQTGSQDGGQDPGTEQTGKAESRSLRIRVAVSPVGDEQKLSKVEFVQ